MLKNLDQKSILILFLLLAFLPYCYLSFFSQPIAEDFGFAFQFQEHDSFYKLLKNSYLTMNGRYIANVFMYLNPISFNSFLGYKLFPVLLVFLLVLGNMFVIKSLKITRHEKDNFIYGLILSILFLHNLPILSEGLYWYTGSSIYLLGILFFLFFLSLAIKLYKSHRKIHLFGFSIILLFICCGFNEVLTLLIVFFLWVFTFFLFYRKKQPKGVFLTLSVCALAFASIMIFAPGNSYREAMYPLKGDFLNTASMSVAQTLRFGFWWTFSIPLLTASILFYRAQTKLNLNYYKVFKTISKQGKLFLALLLPLTIMLCVIPPYWFTGILGQHRTLNVAYFFFIVIWFLNALVWSDQIKKTKNLLKFYISSKILFVFMIGGLLFTGNGFYAFKDIFSGSAYKFNEQMKYRHAILFNNNETKPKEIILKPIIFKPKTLFVIDISTNPNFWTNKGYNGFFKLPQTSIYIEEIEQ